MKMKKVLENQGLFLAEKERFELSRRYTRPTPLAGAPLRPLEYFSIKVGSLFADPTTISQNFLKCNTFFEFFQIIFLYF